MATAALGTQTSTLKVNVFDGTREPMDTNSVSVLYRIIDGHQRKVVEKESSSSSVQFNGLPFYDNFGDNYTVIAWAKGYRQAGFTPVKLHPDHPIEIDLMLLPEKMECDFSDAAWSEIYSKMPFLASGLGMEAAKQRYETLMREKPKCIAALLNITTAMGQIYLRAGTPLNFLKEIKWDDSFAQDRFFAYCDPVLVEQIRLAAHHGLFEAELGCGVMHKGATASWKQVQFGQGNVQLTFHEEDKKVIDGLECIVVEPDIDCHKDLGAHALLEVIPNKLTGGLTDPEMVYVLRWIAGRAAGVPEFNPPYKINRRKGE
jgi:hypothetical protein